LLDITALSELEAQAFRYIALTSANHVNVTTKKMENVLQSRDGIFRCTPNHPEIMNRED
jgi:hypothetical protein